ncbi:7-cyano-7-deazaguanine synthase QueC [Undibacterium terreum]|uniref:7-cyano-7-deazaguanine synthase n=1 Tax=Undibacterium terreum TaxID=1224302 RepID=A0A916XNW2_9BURK|nr:7-cyano-7-deazaguanine synthase QueC [Undibacterium terreum]GGC88444.1 7-cyano-7-deazaguanine synthase [Undibacterium terreum]
MNISTDGALVLFSGGQDSTTCLAWALSRYSKVETIGFDYGQRHAIELTVRPTLLQKMRGYSEDWQQKLGEDHMIDLSLISQLSHTAMTEDIEIVMQENGLPNTFVPGRNLMFMMVAATLAYRRGLNVLVGGMCETDFSGYPDCRDDTMKALQVALNLGMATRLKLETPLMWIDKAQTWELAQDLGGEALVNLIRSDTHTCYLGERGQLHDWGHGCGKCPACELRARGYQQFAEKIRNNKIAKE